MRLNSIKVSNFLRIKQATIHFERPVVLVAGRNKNGKSSLAEAVRQAFTEQPTRVDTKKDFSLLVNDQAKVGSVVIEHSQGETTLVVPQGEGQGQSTHGAMPFVLDPPRFSGIEPKARREFLLKLMGVKMSSAEVIKRLIERGVDKQKAEEVTPLLAAGFDSAQKEADSKATKAKGVWKGITQENWGIQKAEGWKAEVPSIDESRMKELQAALAEINDEIEGVLKAIGEAGAQPFSADALREKVIELREKSGKYARIQHKLNVDLEQETEWANKLAEAKQAAGGKREGLIHDMAKAIHFLVVHIDGNEPHQAQEGVVSAACELLQEYETLHGALDQKGNPELAAKVPEYQKAYDLICNSVKNGRRDLAEADAAAQTLATVEAQLAEAGDVDARAKKLAGLNAQHDELKAEKKQTEAQIKAEEESIAKAKQAEERTANATAAHNDVKAWQAISAALKPEGIPSDFMKAALQPFNNTLQEFSDVAGWGPLRVLDDMSIESEGYQYRMCSESHKWRIDTLLACCIAALSELKFVVLDRFDLLDNKGRSDALYLLDDLIANADLECALVLATLKEKSKNLPAHIQAEWIEDGVLNAHLVDEVATA